MAHLDLHELKLRCIRAVLLKHQIGLAEHFAAQMSEELGVSIPTGNVTPQDLLDLIAAVEKQRTLGTKPPKAEKAPKAPKKPSVKTVTVKPPADGTDATKVIQNAMDEAVGGQVKLAPGNYQISETLSTSSGNTNTTIVLDTPVTPSVSIPTVFSGESVTEAPLTYTIGQPQEKVLVQVDPEGNPLKEEEDPPFVTEDDDLSDLLS